MYDPVHVHEAKRYRLVQAERAAARRRLRELLSQKPCACGSTRFRVDGARECVGCVLQRRYARISVSRETDVQ